MPGPSEMRALGAGAVDDPAQFLLAHTGELNLTDAQVTRLAAIARRSAERRRAFGLQMDSLRAQRAPGAARPDSADRERMRQSFEQMRPGMERLRDQAQADRRDAIAVLTPDQQARAWERVATSGRMQRHGMRGGFSPRRGRSGNGMGVRGWAGLRRMGRPNEGRREAMPNRRPDDQR